MAFVPALWSKFGTNLKDLLTKKYDYKNQLIIKNNVANDLAIESTVTLGDAQSFNGAVKATYKNKDFGQVESEVGTVPNKDKACLSTEIKATKVYDGLTLILKGTDVPNLKATAEYKQESVAVSLASDFSKERTEVEGALTAGFDGFAVGGQGKYCSNHGVNDYNFGAEYNQTEYVLTLKTESKTEKLVGSYWHNVPTSRNKLKTQIGGQVNWNMESGSKVFTVGTEHDVDENTTVKGKLDTEGVLGTVIEHRVGNPRLKLNLSTNWQVKDKTTKPKQFGVALTFGDF